jgi:hypothetical protein
MLVLAAGATVLAFAGVAGAGGGANNVKNGNFETGDLSGWNWDCSSCDGAWLVSKAKTTPSGFSWFGPMQGDYSALADENAVDTLFLWQTFKIGKPNGKLTFTADWDNHSPNGWCNLVLDFDFTHDCGGPGLNQQFRIDVLAKGASPYTTDPGDILKTIFQTQYNTPLQQPKISFSVKLGSISGKVTLRVVVVAGDLNLNVGIDKVNVNNGG